MKIAFFKLGESEREYVQKSTIMQGHELVFVESVLSKDTLPEDKSFEVLSVFVDSVVDEQVIEQFPNLKLIAARSTGYDHIDLAAAIKRNVVVVNVPTYGENTVAEFTFALLLALSRKIFDSVHRIKEDGDFHLEGLRGFDLKGRTIGVVGTGRIGAHVIKIAKGFGMTVVAHDPFPNVKLAQEFGFDYKSLDELLSISDVVTLHVPYTESTKHLLNKGNIKLMKKGSYLINTARGGLVETESLVDALKDGTLGGAGLDVLEEEGIIKDELHFLTKGGLDGHDLKTVLQNHVLIDMPNVLITPHNAFNTTEALIRIQETTLGKIDSFSKGTPVNIAK